MKKEKVAYISGKLSHKNQWERHQLFLEAERVALKYWKKGYVVICPHKNDQHLEGALSYEILLAGDKELIKRSDVVVFLPNWKDSLGARTEHRWAKKLKKQIIYDS